MPRPLLYDTTALIAAIRDPARLPAIHRAALSGRHYLTAITIAELQSGARSPQQAALIERLAMLFARHGALLAPRADEWAAAGRLIARAIRRRCAMEPRDHYPDVLIAQVAGRLGAAIVTDNASDLRFWVALGRLDARVAERSDDA